MKGLVEGLLKRWYMKSPQKCLLSRKGKSRQTSLVIMEMSQHGKEWMCSDWEMGKGGAQGKWSCGQWRPGDLNSMGAGASIVTRERSIGELGAGGWERGTTCCVNTPDFVISHQEPWHKCHQALALASWSMVGTDGGYCTFETLTRQRAWWTMDRGSWHCTGDRNQDHPQEKEMQKSKMAGWGGLTNSCEKKPKAEKRKDISIWMQSSKDYQGEIRKPSSAFNAKKQRKTTEWGRLEISSRKLEIPWEHFMQRWAR